MKFKNIVLIIFAGVCLFLIISFSIDFFVEEDSKEKELINITTQNSNKTKDKMMEILDAEIEIVKSLNKTGWVCFDYANYYNQSLRKYDYLDIRLIRHFDLCNDLVYCENYHTVVLVGGYGYECILDQEGHTCLKFDFIVNKTEV